MDEVAAAIADPVRREILEMLRERPLPARRIAERFPISRPAVSRHLRVLRESGLVRDTAAGRERHYRLDPTRFTELSGWLAGFTALTTADTTDLTTLDATDLTTLDATGPATADATALTTADATGPATADATGPATADATGPAAPDAAGVWDRRLDALETEIHRTRRDRRQAGAAPDRQEKSA